MNAPARKLPPPRRTESGVRPRAFADGEVIGHWTLLRYKWDRWQCRCICGAVSWVQIRLREYVPKCPVCNESAGRKVDSVRAKYLSVR